MTLVSTQPPLQGVSGFFSVTQRPGCQVHNPPPYTVEVKNEFNCTFNSVVCLNGLDRENFTEVGKSRNTRTENNTKTQFPLKPHIRNSRDADVCVRQEDNMSSSRLTITDNIKLFACYVNIQASNQQSIEEIGSQTHFYSDRYS